MEIAKIHPTKLEFISIRKKVGRLEEIAKYQCKNVFQPMQKGWKEVGKVGRPLPTSFQPGWKRLEGLSTTGKNGTKHVQPSNLPTNFL